MTIAPNTAVDDQACSTAVSTLAQVLRQGSEPEQCLAAQALGASSESFDVLSDALMDPDPDVRFDVAEALATLGDKRAIPGLMDNLRDDPVGEIKVAYIKALARLGARDAAPMLASLVVGRSEAAGVCWDDEYSEWDDWLDVQIAAIEALATVGSASQVDMIKTAMTDPEGQDLWAMGSRTLARLGDAGCEALADLVETAPPLARQRIAASLTDADSDTGRRLLAQLCQDASTQVRIASLQSAAASGAIDLCLAGIRDVAPDVREVAVGIVAAADTSAAAALLDDVSQAVRIAAYNAIAASGRSQAGLGICGRLERGLRREKTELLAAMVPALAAAEPDAAEDVLEDIANHRATDPAVRRVTLRALSDLETKNVVSILAEAAGDKRQDLRLEAIAGLGRIVSRRGPMAPQAQSVLSSAIDGALVEVPEGWEPDAKDNVLSLPPRKGRQAAGEDGDARIRIDREGNIVPAAKPKAEAEAEAASEPEDPIPAEIAAPVSTLDAILAPQAQVHVEEESVEISEDELSFLELTKSRPGRRKVAVGESAPAHQDVRRLAARIASDVGDEALVLPLTRALGEKDEELASAAATALANLGGSGVDITPATPQLLEQVEHSDSNARRLAVIALSHIPGDAITNTLARALKDPAGNVRTAAFEAAAGRRDIEIDLPAVHADPDRRVRLAAARLIAARGGDDKIDQLLDIALMDGGIHKLEIARLLAAIGPSAADRLSARLDKATPEERLTLLAMSRTLLAGQVAAVA